MKRLSRITFIAPLVLALSLSSWGAPSITEVGNEESPGGGIFRVAVAVDSQGQPHLVAQNGYNGTSSSQWSFMSRINGSWRVDGFNWANYHSPAVEFLFPHIEIDRATDYAWVSGVGFGAGVINACIMGVIGRPSMSSNPGSFYVTRTKANTTIPLGQVSLAPGVHDRAYLYVNYGWIQQQLLGSNGNLSQGDSTRTLITKNCSERMLYAFSISKASKGGFPNGVGHTAYCGHPSLSSYEYGEYQNSVRESQGLGPVRWSYSGSYAGHEEDNYMALGTDAVNPEVAYMAIYGLDGRVLVNIWDGSQMLYALNNLFSMPATDSGVRRLPPKWAASPNGGAWLTWVNNNRIYVRYFSPTGNHGEITEVAEGNMPGIACDTNGNLHLAYNRSGMRYRKVNVNEGPATPACLAATQGFNISSPGLWYFGQFDFEVSAWASGQGGYGNGSVNCVFENHNRWYGLVLMDYNLGGYSEITYFNRHDLTSSMP